MGQVSFSKVNMFLFEIPKVIDVYMKKDDISMQSAIRDCITDLLNYADENGLDIRAISNGALQVSKDEKLTKEQDLECMIRIEVMNDGDTYISKVTKDVKELGNFIHHPLTDEGVANLKVDLEDYGFPEERILEAIDNLSFAPINERVEI